LTDEGPGDCLGVGFDAAHPVPIAKIIADRAEVHFIKNASADPACPDDSDSCLQADYLMPGDPVLVGKTRGDYRCVSYQSAADRAPRRIGWLPSASLTPVMPAAASSLADWIGRWVDADGQIIISKGRRSNLEIEGETVYRAGAEAHSGAIRTEAKPAHGLSSFFTMADARSCAVRMQRIANVLVVEDDGRCGAAPQVTFTGFYQRKD